MQVSLKNNFGESGYADVRVARNLVRVTFDSGIVFEVPVDQWDASRKNGKYNLTMSKDGTKIMAVRPVAGSYILEFTGIGNRINEVPEPKIQKGGPRQSKDGSKKWFQPDSLAWTAKVEVLTEGMYQGLTGGINLPYIFSPIPSSPYTQMSGTKNELERLEVFLRVAGFDLTSEEIPYQTNVLPYLEKRLGEVKRPFLGSFTEKGFIENLSELPRELMPNRTPAKKGKK